MNEPSPGTAPKVRSTDVEACIAHEHYFTAYDAAMATTENRLAVPPQLKLLTICVLTLANGFTVLGTSACASPENFDAAYGRKLARGKAVDQIWPLLGYELRTKLHLAPKVAQAISLLDNWAADCEHNAGVAGNDAAYTAEMMADGASYRAAIGALTP